MAQRGRAVRTAACVALLAGVVAGLGAVPAFAGAPRDPLPPGEPGLIGHAARLGRSRPAPAVAAPTLAVRSAHGAAGVDVSYPQCSAAGAYPAAGFGIVGVNDGLDFSVNPCLGSGDGAPGSELEWAADLDGGLADFYVVSGDRGAASPHWPGRHGNPTGPRPCTGSSADAGCSFDYGYHAGTYDVDRVIAAEEQVTGAAPPDAILTATGSPWWIDVESAESWLVALVPGHLSAAAALRGDRAALAGEIAGLRARGVQQVGLYSGRGWWRQVMGSTGGLFAAYPEWGEGVDTSLSNALVVCSRTGFAGGVVTQAQWTAATGADRDVDCQGPGGYVPVRPAAVLARRLGPGEVVTVQLAGTHGLPAQGVGAAVVSLTASGAARAGSITTSSAGAPVPALRYPSKSAASGQTVVALDPAGAITIDNRSSAAVNALARVSGYLLSGAPAGGVSAIPAVPLPPLGGRLPAGRTAAVPVRGQAGVPTGASAALLSVTVTGPHLPGPLSVRAAGAQAAGAAAMWLTGAEGQTAELVVRLGADGTVYLHNGTAAAVRVRTAVSGYVLARPGGPAPGDLVTTAAPRPFLGRLLRAGQRLAVPVAGRAGVPSHATAVLLEATATGRDVAGRLAVGPAGPEGLVAGSGEVVFPRAGRASAELLAPLGPGGRLAVAALQGAAQVGLRVVGYVAG